jgi:uncharacterized membrane protein YccC
MGIFSSISTYGEKISTVPFTLRVIAVADIEQDADDPGILAGFLHKIADPVHTALQYAIVSFLSFSLALTISTHVQGTPDSVTIGALWAMISAIVVTQETRSATIDTAWLRIFGSLVGAAISAVYLLFLPFSVVGMAVLVGLTVLACQLLGIPGHARLAALTAGVIMVVSALNPDIPPLVNAGTRFFEVIIGSTVAVAVIWVWPYLFRPSQKTG